MYVCWSRLSFGDSVRARFLKLNLAKNTKIRVSVKRNRGLINCSAASSGEIFKGLYRTNACPECFDSPTPSPLYWLLGGGNDCSYSRAPDLPLCTSQTRLPVMQWCMVSDRQQSRLAHACPFQPPWPSSRPSFHPPMWWITLSPRCFHNKSVTVRIMQADSYSLAECAIREG